MVATKNWHLLGAVLLLTSLAILTWSWWPFQSNHQYINTTTAYNQGWDPGDFAPDTSRELDTFIQHLDLELIVPIKTWVGELYGKMWLHLRLIPLYGSPESRYLLNARRIRFNSISLLGLSGGMMRIICGVGVIMGSFLALKEFLFTFTQRWRAIEQIYR